MIFIEVIAVKGRLDPAERARVARRLGSLAELGGGSDGSQTQPGTAEVFRTMFQVVIHEPEVWVTGEELVTSADPARYVVRAYVPAPWRKDLSQVLITHVTRVLSEAGGGTPAEPAGAAAARVQVHVLGVTEGSIGIGGEARTSTDLVDMLGAPYEADLAAGRAVRDPLCGVIIPLNEHAVTLEIAGTLYGFCCRGCRDAFLAKRDAEGVPV
ncbi:hypothetical protein ABNF97_29405 [Plantactinospora sp. B6F1]|uniref:YHS domain protein n=1 Tax=Plantactinospora sp. B6F1 TaxID=3158971 RepID=UPI00102B51CF